MDLFVSMHEFNSFIHESFLNVLYVDTHPGFIYLFIYFYPQKTNVFFYNTVWFHNYRVYFIQT